MNIKKFTQSPWRSEEGSHEELCDLLVGRQVVAADEDAGTLTLDNGIVLEVQKEESDCCSWISLSKLATTPSVITAAKIEHDDDGEDEYNAWLHVITEAGELNIIEADADATNGYYLHGFALDVTAHFPTT